MLRATEPHKTDRVVVSVNFVQSGLFIYFFLQEVAGPFTSGVVCFFFVTFLAAVHKRRTTCCVSQAVVSMHPCVGIHDDLYHNLLGAFK